MRYSKIAQKIIDRKDADKAQEAAKYLCKKCGGELIPLCRGQLACKDCGEIQ